MKLEGGLVLRYIQKESQLQRHCADTVGKHLIYICSLRRIEWYKSPPRGMPIAISRYKTIAVHKVTFLQVRLQESKEYSLCGRTEVFSQVRIRGGWWDLVIAGIIKTELD